MKPVAILRDFVIYFLLVFFVSAVVTYIYSLLVHGQGIADWEMAVRLAIIFGITFPLVRILEQRKKS